MPQKAPAIQLTPGRHSSLDEFNRTPRAQNGDVDRDRPDGDGAEDVIGQATEPWSIFTALLLIALDGVRDEPKRWSCVLLGTVPSPLRQRGGDEFTWPYPFEKAGASIVAFHD